MKVANLIQNKTGFELKDWVQIIAWVQTISGVLMLGISVAIGFLLDQQISILNPPHNSSTSARGEEETDFILFPSSELKMCLVVGIILTAAFFSSGFILFIGVDKSHPWIYVKTSLASFLLLLFLALFLICKGSSIAESLNNFSQISLLLAAVLISALSPSIILLYQQKQNYCQQNKEPNIEIMTRDSVNKSPVFNVEKENPVQPQPHAHDSITWKKIFLGANNFFQSRNKNQNQNNALVIPLVHGHGQNQSQIISNNEY